MYGGHSPGKMFLLIVAIFTLFSLAQNAYAQNNCQTQWDDEGNRLMTCEGDPCTYFWDSEGVQQETICPDGSEGRTRTSSGLEEIGGGNEGSSEDKKETAVNSCDDAVKRAQYCCENPLACAKNKDIGPGMDTVHGVVTGSAVALSVLGGMAGKTHEVCKATNTVSQISTAVNGIMAATCHWTVSKCQKACSADEDYGGRRQCAELRQKANTYIARGLYDQMQAFVARQCADMTKTSTASAPQVKGGTMRTCSDPSSPEYHTPQCVCMRPDAHLKKECIGLNGKMDQASAGSTSPGDYGLGGDGKDSFGVADDDEAYQQKPNFGGPEGQESQANVGNKGGGGGLGSFSSGSGGAGGSGGAAGEAGFKTNIEQGERGGSGYSANPVAVNRGGGYSQKSGGGKKDSGSKFNLKDFLPNGKKVKRRSIASFMSNQGAPEIGGPHENIFERISKRFYKLCLEGQLYKCEVSRRGR